MDNNNQEPIKTEAEKETAGIGKTTVDKSGSGTAYLILGLLIILTAAVGIFVYSTYLVKNQLVKSSQQKIDEVDKKIEEMSGLEERSVALKNAVENINSLISGQKKWSRLLQTVANRTLKKIRLTQISLDEKGVFRIEGLAKGYGDVAKMAASIREDDSFENVVIEEATYAPPLKGSALTISFSIECQLTNEALKEASKEG